MHILLPICNASKNKREDRYIPLSIIQSVDNTFFVVEIASRFLFFAEATSHNIVDGKSFPYVEF